MNKSFLLEHLIETIKQKMDTVQEAINLVQQSANQETKSTAGDKYETARAMAQNERDILMRQFLQIKSDYTTLQQLDIRQKSDRVTPGTLTTTTFGTLFLSVSIGLVTWEGEKVMVVSPASPVGKAIMGKQEGEYFIFQGKNHQVIRIE
jgi:transcription elongation GreA/GreB family factor